MVVRLRVEIARLEAAYPADPGLGKSGGSSVHRPDRERRSTGRHAVREGAVLRGAARIGEVVLQWATQTWRAGDVEGVGHDR